MFCCLYSLGICLMLLYRQRQGRTTKNNDDNTVSILEMNMRHDLQVLVVKAHDPKSTRSLPKSALWTPERKESLGKTVECVTTRGSLCHLDERYTESRMRHKPCGLEMSHSSGPDGECYFWRLIERVPRATLLFIWKGNAKRAGKASTILSQDVLIQLLVSIYMPLMG